MSGYTRQSESGIIDGGVISASDFNSEFDALACAMSTSGHTHDGTSGEGPKITTAGIASNAVTTDKINTAAVTGAKIDSSTTITAACFCGNVAGNATGITNVTSTTAELNCLDGLTATTAELNYVDGVTSSIQTQIDGKIGNVCEDTSPQLGGTLDAVGNSICDVSLFKTCCHNGACAHILVNNLYDEAELRGTALNIYAEGACGFGIRTSGALYKTTAICVCCNGTCGLACDDTCVILYSRNDAKLCTTPTGVNTGCVNLLCATFNGGGGLKFSGGCKFCTYDYGSCTPGFTFAGADEAGNTITVGSCSCVNYTNIGNLTQIYGYIETSNVTLCCAYDVPLCMCGLPGGLSGNSCVTRQIFNNVLSCGWSSSASAPQAVLTGDGIQFHKSDGTVLKVCDLACHTSSTCNKIHFNYFV